MNNGHIANPELRHRSLSQFVHLGERHLLVRLVVEVPSTPPAGIVAHNSVEYDNRSISRLLDSFDDLPAPPLTGGRSAISSSGCSRASGPAYSRLTDIAIDGSRSFSLGNRFS